MQPRRFGSISAAMTWEAECKVQDLLSSTIHHVKGLHCCLAAKARVPEGSAVKASTVLTEQAIRLYTQYSMCIREKERAG